MGSDPQNTYQLVAQELKFVYPLRITVDPYLLEAAAFKTKQNKQKKKTPKTLLYFETWEALQGVVKLLQSSHIVFFQLLSDNILHSQK